MFRVSCARHVALTSLLLAVAALSLSAQTAWRRLLPLSASTDIRHVAANADRFVAVGLGGNIITSEDGFDWIERDSGTWENLSRILHHNGTFVTVGAAGSVLTSPDGITWTQRTGGIGSDKFAAGNGTFVVLGNSVDQKHALIVSDDAVSWTELSQSSRPDNITFGLGIFLLSSDFMPLRYSVDGRSWTPVMLNGGSVAASLLRLPTFLDDVGLTTSSNGPGLNRLHRSTDGVNWTTVETPFALGQISESGGRFIAGTSTDNSAYESTDGLNWSLHDPDISLARNAVTLGNVSIDENFTQRRINGGDWTSLHPGVRPHPFPFHRFKSLTHGEGIWLSNHGLRSTDDGETWLPIPPGSWHDASGAGRLQLDVSFAHGRFFVIGSDPGNVPTVIWSSTDALNFTRDAVLDQHLTGDVHYANGTWIALQTNGRSVFRSADGITWTEHANALPAAAGSPTDSSFPGRNLTSDESRYVLSIKGAGLYESADGLAWNKLPTNTPLTDAGLELDFANGHFVGTDGQRVFDSTDAATWTVSTPPLTSVAGVHHSGDRIVAVGVDKWSNDLIFAASSADNVHWTRSTQSFNNHFSDLRAIASSATTTLVAVADNVYYSRHDAGPHLGNLPAGTVTDLLEGRPYGFGITATSDQTLNYQWSSGGLKIAGANQPTLNAAAGSPTFGPPIPIAVEVSDGTWSTAVVHYVRIQRNVPPSRSNSTGLSVSKLLGELNATRITLRPAIGGPNISVQWFRDGVPLVRPTATNWDLQIPVNAYTIGHRYHVVATNAAGVVSSDDYIVAAPNLTAVTIESAYYEGAEWLRANGNDIAHYQWRINGVPIPGATSSILYTTSLYDGQALPSGFIDVLAFNRTQTVRSATFRFQRDEDAALPIETPTYAFKNLRQPYLSNLSIRGAVGVGEAALVPGFVISSDPIESLDRPLSVIVRAVGPGLAAFGVGDRLSDPRVTIYNSAGEVLHQNDRWQDAASALATQFKNVGAFALAEASADAALLADFAPHPGTIVSTAPVTAASGASSGEALVELYVVPGGNGSVLTNLSARGQLDAERPLTIGFVIAGDTPLSLVLRALGPALADFGIESPAASPSLLLFNAAGEQIAAAATSYPTYVGPTETALGALPIIPESPNAWLSITLPPGAYTAQARDDSPGIALIELFLAPPPFLFDIPIVVQPVPD